MQNHGQPIACKGGRVYRVIDGDTVVVQTTWRRVTLRLDSIDCPEHDQYWGDTARYGLTKLIGGRSIRFEEHTEDEYGRTLATVFVRPEGQRNWINVNARMVTLGHAWVYRQHYSHLPIVRQTELDNLERWARLNNIGLWKDANPVPPWEWRSGAVLKPGSVAVIGQMRVH